MARPGNWSVVGFGSDPTPGDPAVVRDGASKFTGVADRIARCAEALRSLDAGVSQADSVTALLESRDELVTAALGAEGRYRETGAALSEYATALDRVQQATQDALLVAGSAKLDADDAKRMVAWYENMSNDLGEDQEDQARVYEARQGEWREAAQDAQSVIDAQVQVVQGAIADRDSAAQAAIERIEAATSSDGLSDSWWDDWGSKVTAWITTIAEWVSTIAGLLALVVCWIPVIGQALAAALVAIAAVAGVIAAIGSFLQAMHGEKSWADFALSLVFAALGCVGLGGLRGIGRSIKGLTTLRSMWAANGGARAFGGLRGVLAATFGNAKTAAKGLWAGAKQLPGRVLDGFKRLRRTAMALDDMARSLVAGTTHTHTGSTATHLDDLLARRADAIEARNAAKAHLEEILPGGHTLSDFSRRRVSRTLSELQSEAAGDISKLQDIKDLDISARALSTARNRVTTVGEDIGVAGGQAVVRANGYDLVSEFAGSGVGAGHLDGLAISPDSSTMLFPEFKGMSARLGTRNVGGVPVAQGTPEYVMDIMLNDPRFPQYLADNPAVWDRIITGHMKFELAVLRTDNAAFTTIIKAHDFQLDAATLNQLTTKVDKILSTAQ